MIGECVFACLADQACIEDARDEEDIIEDAGEGDAATGIEEVGVGLVGVGVWAPTEPLAADRCPDTMGY